MKKLLLVFFAMFTMVSMVDAQRAVSGTVTTESGDPLIGANVIVKGTNIGTVTDENGYYSLTVPDDATTLVVSFIGYDSYEMAIGASNVLDVSLSEGIVLEETVVTALGISRDEKSLGYGIQSVGNDQPSRIESYKYS